MNKIKLILLAAIFGFALAFTFSCSSDDGEEDNTHGEGHTYKAISDFNEAIRLYPSFAEDI